MKKQVFFYLLITLVIFSLVALVGCGGKSQADTIYNEIEQVLDEKYEELGSPAVNWDNMDAVKDAAWKEIIQKQSDWEGTNSFSLSVMDDHIYIYVKSDGKEKEGEWRP